MATRLRLYRAPDDEFFGDDGAVATAPPPDVRVRLGDLLPLVGMAQKMNLAWVRDFLDDEVCVTRDLHEVMQTFRGCRPRAS